MTPAQHETFTKLAKEYLEDRGYEVTLLADSVKMMTPGQFRASLGVKLTPQGLFKRLNHDRCPPFESITGDSGRLLKLRPHKKLRAFCSQPISDGSTSLLPVEHLGDFHHDDGR